MTYGNKYSEEQALSYAKAKQDEAIRDINRNVIQFRLINNTPNKVISQLLNITQDPDVFNGVDDAGGRPTPPTVFPLLDLDGNVYTVITIGSRQIIVENLRTTKYADGSSIPEIIQNQIIAFTGWQNNPSALWDTLTTSGLDITSGISAGLAEANALIVPDDLIIWPGAILTITISGFTLNSGTAPNLFIGNDLNSNVLYNQPLADGVIIIPITEYTALSAAIINNDGIGGPPFASDFSVNIAISAIPTTGWANDTTGAYCWHNNDISTMALYGAKYNWFALNNASGLVYFERGGVQELGWRLITNADLIAISTELGGDLIAGGILKEIGTAHWDPPNTGATDDYGFKALPAGAREATGVFNFLNQLAFFWTKDEVDAANAYSVELLFNSTLFNRSASDKINGLSVRCVRDI